MKRISIVVLTASLLLTILLSSCRKNTDTGAYGYSYWTGAIPNSYYMYNVMGEPGRTVTGKPFLVMKYDKVTLQVVDCEFGLSEVTQTGYSTPSGIGVAPEPTLNASTIDYQSKLGLVSPVDLLVEWNISGYTTKDSVVNGYQSFSFHRKGSGIGGVVYDEAFNFIYNNVSMRGTMQNADTVYYLGSQSDSVGFHLLKL
ncbi:MAG: hypothetical protein JSS76_10210 [Bacteroidetes bacterium]|nr:hypothetical protein [Bacteroidota bacterium]